MAQFHDEQRPLRVLNVEDSEDDSLLLRRHLQRAGFDLQLTRVDTPTAMADAFDAQAWDVVIADYSMPHFSALAALALLKELGQDVPFIIVSGEIGEETAVAAMHAGAHDYLMKGNLARLAPAVERELQEAENRRERRRVEQEREQLLANEQRARREAEQANRSKDEFLATVSHELRTPLTSILGWAHLLRNGSLDATMSARALDTIERNARAQAQLVGDILDISRIVTGKLRLDVRPVELASIIEAAIDSARPSAEAKGIRIQTMLDHGAGPVSGDPDRLQQIVWNLLTNAIKFTPKGGRVQVRLERINSHVEVVVSDTGRGINADFLPHVFDRFRQADGTATREHGGLGLGLAIVRHLTEMHGGTVTADSDGEDRGATFTLKLPLMIVHHAPQPEEERVHPKAHARATLEKSSLLEGLRVLVVDDEADTREMISVVLEPYGAEVTTVGSAAEALQALAQLKPHVLVSDIGMPLMDGNELIRQVRSLSAEQGGRIPAAALTAYAGVEDRLRSLLSGFQIHVPKPVEPAELVAVVASLAGRRSII